MKAATGGNQHWQPMGGGWQLVDTSLGTGSYAIATGELA